MNPDAGVKERGWSHIDATAVITMNEKVIGGGGGGKDSNLGKVKDLCCN